MASKTSVEPGNQPQKDYLVIRFDWYRAILAAVIIFTVVTRLYGLAYKPYHHDESLYAKYSWDLYEGRGYKYDPMMHGPFMFHLNSLIFTISGVSDFTARLSAALFGIALVCCTPLLRRRLGKIGSLAAAVFFAVSPFYMYFSRFLRHDIYFALWVFLIVAFYVNYLDTRRRGFLYGCAAAVAFMFCVKENSYLTLFIFVSYLVFAKIFEKIFHAPATEPKTGQQRDKRTVSRMIDIIICVAVFFGLFYLFYTTFLTHSAGFVDGLYRKSLGYWVHQDKIQRIKGAFTYFCPIAVTYELPLLVIVFSGIVALLKGRRLSRIMLIASSAIALPLIIFWHQKLPVVPWDSRFHMTSTMHVVFALYVFIIGLTATCHYLKDGRRFPAFLAYWSWTTLLIYSYAGEKVPWLLMHVLMPFILWASLFLDEFLRSDRFRRAAALYTVLMAVGLFLFLQASIRLCFFNEANPEERMVYTQTSEDITKSLKEISDIAERTGKGLNLPIGVQGDATWPYTWYLRDYKRWFHPGAFTSPREAVIVVDWTKRGQYRNVLEPNYVEKKIKLREWWVPEPVSRLNNPLAAWLRYYFRREPWNPSGVRHWDGRTTACGSQDVAFYVRKDLAGSEMVGAREALEDIPSGRPTPFIPEKYSIVRRVPPLHVFGEKGIAPGRFNEPRGIWVDKKGNIYVADTKNQRWQKFDGNGKCLLSVGKGGQGQAEFKDPMGIAVDADGDVYVADTWNHRIQKFDRYGNFLKQWKGGGGGFWAPKGMAFDSRGDLYVVDTGGHRVQKFTRDGKSLRFWGCEGEETGQFSEPVGIAVERDAVIKPAGDKKGEREIRGDVLYIADTLNRRVQKFDINGKFLGQFGVLGWDDRYVEPFISLDSEGRIWLTDALSNRIEIFDPDGKLLCLWSASGFRPGDFNIPKGIFVRDGRVYISDTFNNRIQVFDEKNVFKK